MEFGALGLAERVIVAVSAGVLPPHCSISGVLEGFYFGHDNDSNDTTFVFKDTLLYFMTKRQKSKLSFEEALRETMKGLALILPILPD